MLVFTILHILDGAVEVSKNLLNHLVRFVERFLLSLYLR